MPYLMIQQIWFPMMYGEWIGSYTKIEFEIYMAIGEKIYLSFNQKDLDNCERIEGLFLLREYAFAKTYR